MRRALPLLCVAFLLLSMAVPAFAVSAAMADGPHDLSTGSTATTHSTGGTDPDRICVFCHTPHNANPSATSPPLWNRAETAWAFATLYTSSTFDMGPAAMTSLSTACFACHDGVGAVDALRLFDGAATAGGDFGWAGNVAPATGLMTDTTFADDDMSDDHPIGFTYDPLADTGFNDVATLRTNGAEVFGAAGSETVECGSCHETHGDGAIPALLRVTTADSALCAACHLK